MQKPKILDLFCCQGGAAMGYHLAGFEVVGVDINPQPKYPFEFYQADAINFDCTGFDAIHASPPCQAFTRARKLQGNIHADLIGVTRAKLVATGLPFIIENVPGAPLQTPIVLCGLMFGLNFYRHRHFEVSFPCDTPEHSQHTRPLAKMGRPPKENEVLQFVGHFSGVPRGRKELCTPWMSQHGMAQCVPPAYTEYIGKQLRAHVLCAERLPDIKEARLTSHNKCMHRTLYAIANRSQFIGGAGEEKCK
jgi:DNA (cytosine-5)-methyltransferase 1